MESTSQCLDDGFLDGPEQGRCLFPISARQTQGMFKLFRMEDPLNGVCSLEFIAPCRIDADIGLIATESGPDSSSTLAERDGRPPIFSHQEPGPAERSAHHPNRGINPGGRWTAVPERMFHRCQVIPEGGDEVVLGFLSVRNLSRCRLRRQATHKEAMHRIPAPFAARNATYGR